MRQASLALILLLAAVAAQPAVPDPNSTTGKSLVLVDKLGARIRFFDPAGFSEISNLDVGVNPHDLAVSPDHKTLYTPVYGDGIYGKNPHPGHTVAVIDLATRQLKGTIDVSPYQAPHGIQVDRKGTVYVTCDISRKVLIINPKTLMVEAAIDTEGTGHWLAVLPDGSKAYIASKNSEPYISVIDLKARKLVGRIPAPNGTEGIAASADGKRVVAVDFKEPSLLIIDTSKDSVVDRVPLEGNSRDSFKPKYSPDGKWLLVCNQKEGLVNVLKTADLHGKQTVLKVGKDPMGFGFAPNGKTALVGNHGDGTVSVIDLDNPKVISSFKAGTGIETLTYY